MNKLLILILSLGLSMPVFAKMTYEWAKQSHINSVNSYTGISENESNDIWKAVEPPNAAADGIWENIHISNQIGGNSYNASKYSMIYFKFHDDSGTKWTSIIPLFDGMGSSVYGYSHNNVSFHNDAQCSGSYGLGYVNGCHDESHGQGADVYVYQIMGLRK